MRRPRSSFVDLADVVWNRNTPVRIQCQAVVSVVTGIDLVAGLPHGSRR